MPVGSLRIEPLLSVVGVRVACRDGNVATV